MKNECERMVDAAEERIQKERGERKRGKKVREEKEERERKQTEERNEAESKERQEKEKISRDELEQKIAESKLRIDDITSLINDIQDNISSSSWDELDTIQIPTKRKRVHETITQYNELRKKLEIIK